MKTLWAGLILCIALQAHAFGKKALFYPIGKVSGTPIYTQESDLTPAADGIMQWTSKIMDAQGKVVMTETARIKDGQVIEQYVEQLQIGEVYELKVEGGKATFETFKLVDGKKGASLDRKTVSFSKPFLMGPATESFLKANWSVLESGKSLKTDFGVFEVSNTVGFEFRKIGEKDKVIEIEMKPSNMFISMVVTAIRIDLDKTEKRIVRYIGRTPLREQVKGKWKALDVEIVYP